MCEKCQLEQYLWGLLCLNEKPVQEWVEWYCHLTLSVQKFPFHNHDDLNQQWKIGGHIHDPHVNE